MLRRPKIVAISAAAALAVAALVVVLVVVAGRGRSKPAASPAPARAPAAQPQSRPSERRRTTTAHRRRTRPPAPRSRSGSRAAQPAQALPWRPNGTSLVANTRGRWLAVYRLPRARHPLVLLRNPDRIGTPRVLLVHSTRRNWVRVYLPLRPNGRTGWVRARSVRLLRNPYRIVVRLRAHTLTVWRGSRVFLRARTVVGTPSTPTPVGTFFIVDLLRPPDPNGAYGPYAYDLSAHSDVLIHFDGGDGHVAIHGTDEPWLLGQSASHGCIRVSNSVIRTLERVLPLGTPVVVRR